MQGYVQVGVGRVVAGDGRRLGLEDYLAPRVVLVRRVVLVIRVPVLVVQVRIRGIARVHELVQHHLAEEVAIDDVLVAVGQGLLGAVVPGVRIVGGIGGVRLVGVIEGADAAGGGGADLAGGRGPGPLDVVLRDAVLLVVLEVVLGVGLDFVIGGRGRVADVGSKRAVGGRVEDVLQPADVTDPAVGDVRGRVVAVIVDAQDVVAAVLTVAVFRSPRLPYWLSPA